jgi:alpha-D-ribose 1-methylphosphonate 5-triphosphate synthase subunit PhnG
VNRRRRCQILIEGSDDILNRICLEIEGEYKVNLIDKPSQGVVMVKMREGGKNSSFYIGEVLVSETRVEINKAIGIGLVKGHHLDKSYKLAVVDAAYNLKSPRTIDWDKLLLEEEKAINIKREIENGRILETMVDFNTMEDQGVSSK